MQTEVDRPALAREGVRLAVGFGSGARGTDGPHSDVDVGVHLGSTTDISLEKLDRLRTALGGEDELDLVVLDLADPLLLFEIAVDGVPLFESHEGAWEEFRILAIKRYYDTAWIRKLEADALRKRHGPS